MRYSLIHHVFAMPKNIFRKQPTRYATRKAASAAAAEVCLDIERQLQADAEGDENYRRTNTVYVVEDGARTLETWALNGDGDPVRLM